MLNTKKLSQAFQKIEPELWFNHGDEQPHARILWRELCNTCPLEPALPASPAPAWLSWPLHTKIVASQPPLYHVIAIDGSQIYPERHEGIRCSLLHTAHIHIEYAQPISYIQTDSTITIENVHTADGQLGTQELDCKRFLQELQHGLDYAKTLRTEQPVLVLIDGPLIFWNISESPRLKQKYFEHYCAILAQYQQKNITLAGYISFPHSKDLINLVRWYAHQKQSPVSFQYLIDTDVLETMLCPHECTPTFLSRVSIARECPEIIQPTFFYCHTGREIARVELLSWLAHDTMCTSTLAQIIIDQCMKGDGYPVSLAHAHEQAIVKKQDREIFYRFLAQKYQARTLSPKKIHKNKLAI